MRFISDFSGEVRFQLNIYLGRYERLMVSAFSNRHLNDHASLTEPSDLELGPSWGSARFSWAQIPRLGEANPTWPVETPALLPINKGRAWLSETRLFVGHSPFGAGIH